MAQQVSIMRLLGCAERPGGGKCATELASQPSSPYFLYYTRSRVEAAQCWLPRRALRLTA